MTLSLFVHEILGLTWSQNGEIADPVKLNNSRRIILT